MRKWLLAESFAPVTRASSLLVALALFASPMWQAEPASASVPDPVTGVCAATPAAPVAVAAEYYNINMAATGSAPGARGYVTKTFAQSPFGVAVTVDGRYIYDVHIRAEGLRGPPETEYTVWVAPPNLSPIVRLGVLDESFELSGQVEFQKLIMFVTAERPGSWDAENAGKTGNAWQGPILMQGISRSGMMHSAAGHGPFEVENC